MARPQPGAIIPVKILVKLKIVTPIRIGLKNFLSAIYGTPAVVITQENANQAARQFARDSVQRQVVTCASGALNAKIVAVIVVKLLQRFDDEIVDGQPLFALVQRTARHEDSEAMYPLAWFGV